MKKSLISLAVVAGLGLSAGAQAVTLTFVTNDESDNAAFPATDPANNAAFGTLAGAADPDFRVLNSGAVSGGGEKAISDGVAWTFDDGTGNMTGVTGSVATPGCSYYCTTNGGTTSAISTGDVGLFKAAPFLGKPFGFLAPTVGSAAAGQYGAGTVSGDTDGNGSFTISFPTLEAQWSGGIFSIGLTNGGVTLNCSATAGNFSCQGDVQIANADDTLGFGGQWPQFDLVGTMPVTGGPAVPVPAAVWLFGSGLVGLVGVARRKKA